MYLPACPTDVPCGWPHATAPACRARATACPCDSDELRGPAAAVCARSRLPSPRSLGSPQVLAVPPPPPVRPRVPVPLAPPLLLPPQLRPARLPAGPPWDASNSP